MRNEGAKIEMNEKTDSRSRSRRAAAALLALCVALACFGVAAASASADFGLKTFDVTFTNEDGTPATQAGSHPFAMTTTLGLNYHEPGQSFPWELDGEMKDLNIEQLAGFIGDATAMPQCATIDFITSIPSTALPECADDTAVGVTAVNLVAPAPFIYLYAPVYNLVPPPGVTAKLGFNILNEKVTVDIGVKDGGQYNLTADTINFPQPLPIFGATLQLWGNPSDHAHDPIRGHCVGSGFEAYSEGELNFASGSTGDCAPGNSTKPFLTLPTACNGPAVTHYGLDPWVAPGHFVFGEATTHDNAEPPNPSGFTGCGKLGFKPTISAQPTTRAAESPTGLDFSLDVADEGLTNVDGLAQSQIKKAVVTLPEGMTVNPSIAEGLTTCSEADLGRETLHSPPGAGCPEASKIGTVNVESPLVDEPINGSLYIASQYQNPFHSLLAMYIVIKNPKLGIIIKQPAKVEPNPATGQLVTTVDDIPQLPFSHFRLHFREGARSPLSSPPACGSYSVKAELTPYSGGEPVTTTSAFEVISGGNNSACPSVGTRPFHPGLQAGTLNNAAGRYSPFDVHLTRNDGEGEFTRFSIKLPPGITGKLAGIPFCPEAGIAQARSRERAGGGAEELAAPSCSAASQVGHTLVGAGVGSALTYVPGKVYLAGAYHGDPLSIVAITSGVVGPFDVGTVVIREALEINPETAEVFIDSTGSDPIPHIIEGIPVHARDIGVNVDRPDFVLNPTSCERTSTASTVTGSGLDFASAADDVPVTVTSRFQAADCARLNYKPRLQLKLKGGTKRGKNPQLTAILRPRPGDANSKRISVALPHSEFLDQSHIKTICTRVQFKAGDGNGSACPKAAIYGHATAWTPLLDEPLTGPVYLRSSEHPLPDLVLALHGLIDFTAVGRIDSVKGGIRNTFEAVPDAPITKVEVRFSGGKKGLLINSTNICKGKHNATLDYTAHSGRSYKAKAPLKGQCGKAHKTKKKHAKHARRR